MGSPGLGGERVARGQFFIEHVMPRKWSANWPLEQGSLEEAERYTCMIHVLGQPDILSAGMLLFPKRKKFADRVATLLSDGRVEVDGVAYDSPSSAAAIKIVGHLRCQCLGIFPN